MPLLNRTTNLDIEQRPRKDTKTASDNRHYPFELPSGWVWTTIEEISESNIGLTYKPSEISEKGIPVYRSNNIQDRKICLDNLVRVQSTILPKQYLNEGDLLICARNGSRNLVGKCALITELYEPTSFGAFMAVCRSTFNPWIFIVLNSNYFNQYLNDSNSTAINQVTQKMLLSFQIPLPPIQQQKRIVTEIEKWFSWIDIIENGKVDLQTTIKQAKNKILDLAIHGKLVPQDPADEPASELLKRVNPSAEITCDNEQYWNMPRGWVICNFNQIFKTVSSKQFQIQQSEILTTGKTPVVSQSSLFIEGYSNESNICKYHPSIIFGDHTRNVKYIDFEFIVGADGVKILMPEFNPKYAYYLIKYATLNIENKGYSRHFGQISKFKFPLPPLAEQQRIVAKIEELFAQLDAIENSLQA